jgi:hypothetical protein
MVFILKESVPFFFIQPKRQDGKTDQTDGTDQNGFLFRLRRIRMSQRRVKVRSRPFSPLHPFSIMSLWLNKQTGQPACKSLQKTATPSMSFAGKCLTLNHQSVVVQDLRQRVAHLRLLE